MASQCQCRALELQNRFIFEFNNSSFASGSDLPSLDIVVVVVVVVAGGYSRLYFVLYLLRYHTRLHSLTFLPPTYPTNHQSISAHHMPSISEKIQYYTDSWTHLAYH